MRETPGATALRGYLGTTWGVIMDADDSKAMQRITVRGLNGELFTQVERPQMYGFSSVPVKPDNNGGKAAEVVLGFRAGNRAHPYVHSEGDRRSRPKNLKPGESKHHDDQGQYSHLARNGHIAVAKNHSITAGEKPEPGEHEVNDQLKGIDARLSHMEHSHAGLFDVASRMRQMLEPLAPVLKTLAPILSQSPDGLTRMTDAIKSTFPAYLQQHIQDASGKFIAPTITGVGSVMGGADDVIAALQAKITSMISANPVVGQVDDLVDELAALRASGSPAVVAGMAPVLQGLVDSATAGNPIVGQVADLRSRLTGLISAAGPGLGFLGPQQRIPVRLSRSLKLTP